MIMIDWVTARIPCNHGDEIAGGAMVSYKDANDFDAGCDWAFAKPLPVVGSQSRTKVRSFVPPWAKRDISSRFTAKKQR